MEAIRDKLSQRWNREYTLVQNGDTVTITVDLKENEKIIDFLPKSYWRWVWHLGGTVIGNSFDIDADSIYDFHDDHPFTSKHIQILSEYYYFIIRETDFLLHEFEDCIVQFPPLYRNLFTIQESGTMNGQDVSIPFEHVDTIVEHLDQIFPLELPILCKQLTKLLKHLKLQDGRWDLLFDQIHITIPCTRKDNYISSAIWYIKHIPLLNKSDCGYRRMDYNRNTVLIYIRNPHETYVRLWNQLVKEPMLTECSQSLSSIILSPLVDLINLYVY